MIYFDAAYIARLYLDDPGCEAVRRLAELDSVACCLYGQGEVVAAIHRKHREQVFTAAEYRTIVEQFTLDCEEQGFHWLPLSPAVISRVTTAYQKLPRSVFLRAADAVHLACAVENRFREIYSNDHRLLAAASHFGIRGVNVI